MDCLLYTSCARHGRDDQAAARVCAVVQDRRGAVSYTHLDVYKRQSDNTAGCYAAAGELLGNIGNISGV